MIGESTTSENVCVCVFLTTVCTSHLSFSSFLTSWDDVCHICFGDGELMCCIGCPRVAHSACVSSSSTTNDGEVANWDYMCADCQGELKKNERKKGDKNENKCHICAEGGTLLCCDSCERAECTFCVRRDLEDIGKGER